MSRWQDKLNGDPLPWLLDAGNPRRAPSGPLPAS